MVKLLLERGADPNIAKHPGWGLHTALLGGVGESLP